jgi:putative chitinase
VNTRALLDFVANRTTGVVGDGIASGLDTYCPQYQIDTHLRLAHFIAQACHETEGFRLLHEIWGPTPAQAKYEGRADLGNVRPGDGFLYRGRGIFQLTGRDNYARMGVALSLPLETNPEMAADPIISAHIACRYWQTHSLNDLADADNVVGITRRINGGTNGLADREAYLARAKEVLP